MPIKDPNSHELQQFGQRYLRCQNQMCNQIMQGIVSYENVTKRTTCWECDEEAKAAAHSLEPQDVENETVRNAQVWIG